jgi:drug/metabolite transporter (DMT)-like permease
MALGGWVGIGVGLAGVLLVLGVAPQELGVSGVLAFAGSLLFLAGSLCWAGFNILSKRLLVQADPIALATGALLFGTCGMAVLFSGERALHVQSAWTWHAAGGVAFAGMSTFLGFLVTTWALKHVEGTRVGAFQYLQPPVGILSGWLLLHEHLGVAFLAGAVLVGAGVVLTAAARIRTLPAVPAAHEAADFELTTAPD